MNHYSKHQRRRGMQSTQHCWLITLWLPLSMWQINTWETLLIRKLYSSIRALREPDKMSFSLHCKRGERSWSDKIGLIFCCVLKSLLKSLNRQLVLVDESPSHSNVRVCRGCYHSDIYIFAQDYLLTWHHKTWHPTTVHMNTLTKANVTFIV